MIIISAVSNPICLEDQESALMSVETYIHTVDRAVFSHTGSRKPGAAVPSGTGDHVVLNLSNLTQ